MKYSSVIILSFLLCLLYSCARVDNNLPYISGLKVNGEGTDTIYLLEGDLNVDYLISDDELIVDSKVKLVQNDNLDSGFIFLSIVSVNSKDYTGNEEIIVPDSIKKHSKLFTLSVDAFDDSGNQAYQLSKLIHFK